MSFRIEITAASLEELADKALALGAQLSQRRTTAPVISPVMPEVAQAAPADPTASSPPTADATPEPQPSGETAPPASASEPVTLDYKTEVAPLVLRLVEVRGKPAAQKLLDQYGASKASEIDAKLWPEFVAQINAELA